MSTTSSLANSTTITTPKVSLLLFGSGMCALIYQMAWLREFRLIFGASTASSAAVLAIFMAGLGLGSLFLGARADRQARPLGFYGSLEVLISVSAALTPLLLWGVREAYIATGGSPVLGLWGATAVRLLLAALVLVVPTFLMGGTLPAAARSVENDQDLGRRNLAFLYGANTLGAVTGTVLATFLLLELFGTRLTLWAACLLNVLIALIARSLSRAAAEGGINTPGLGEAGSKPEPTPGPAPRTRARHSAPARPVLAMEAPDEPPVPANFVLAASAGVGFAFLLMELVWYRILSPILGGSTFTFGLILAVALLGIGLGGAAYAVFRGNRTATLTGFALTCALEAVFIAIPFALGDRVALVAMLLRALSSLGFYGLVGGWLLVTTLAVLPAALVAGYQFPLLIALLGRGRQSVGRHVGLAYTFNTLGAIAGSLAGGFGLMPLLTATGTWRLVVILLALLAVAAVALSARIAVRAGFGRTAGGAAADPDDRDAVSSPLLRRAWLPSLAAALALLLLLPTGPTAAWRHGGIGAGRADRFEAGRNGLRNGVNTQRRTFIWEREGVESSVGVQDGTGYAFYVNGKCDGHIRDDAGTQIMAGLTGAMLHPNPRKAMVIGLGTGSTAGWLGVVQTMERVDVVELEPAILEVARMCRAANHDVMNNPKVHVTVGDAREALLTTPSKYDVIFSEPSNPYRAGIASLYTREFYEAVTQRLEPGGLLGQWVQAYEIDGQTLRTVYATVQSVFPHVETWRTQAGDLLLLASAQPLVHNADMLRQRAAQEPYRSALGGVWHTTTLEGFLARHIANADFARAVSKAHGGPLNTDDRTVVEFGFARSVGVKGDLNPSEVLRLAQSRKEHRPAISGAVDWEAVEDERVAMEALDSKSMALPPDAPLPRRLRAHALTLANQGDAAGSLQTWRQQSRPPTNLIELVCMATVLNESGNPESEKYIEKIRQVSQTEADALLAHLRWRQRRPAEAVPALQSALARYRSDPWAHRLLMERTISLGMDLARADRQGNAARLIYESLSSPFVLHLNEDWRRRAVVAVAAHLDQVTGSTLMPDALDKFEPHVPWEEPFLEARLACYNRVGHRLLMRAAEDLDAYRASQPFPFDYGLRPPPPPTTGATTGPATGPTTGASTQPGLGPISDPLSTDALPGAPLPSPSPSGPGGSAGSSAGGGSAPSPSQGPGAPPFPSAGDSSGGSQKR